MANEKKLKVTVEGKVSKSLKELSPTLEKLSATTKDAQEAFQNFTSTVSSELNNINLGKVKESFKSAFENTNKEIEKTTKEFSKLFDTLKENMDFESISKSIDGLFNRGLKTTKFSNELNKIKDDVNNLAEVFETKLRKGIDDLNSRLAQGTINQEDYDKAVKKLTKHIKEEANDAVTSLQKRYESLGKAVMNSSKDMSMWGKFTKSFWSNVRSFVSYRLINTIAQIGKAAVKSGMELESAFANIQAIVSASDVEMSKLRNTILRVGEASKYSTEEIAKATTMLGQAGLTADEINNVLETTTQLAAGTGSELSNTVDLMTSALAVWGLNSEEASHLSDVMVTGMNRTKATLETFRMAVQYAGATMASLNVSFDEFASVAAAASNAGLRASVVGTGLRAMTSELISPTKKMVAGLAQLGLSTEDVNIESQGLVNVLYKLKNAGLTAANAYDLFGKRAAQFVLAAQGQLDVVDELRVAFAESGATLKAYNTQMNTLKAQWQALINTIKELGYHIYDLIDGPLKALLKTLNSVTKAFNWLFLDKDKRRFEEQRKEFDENRKSAESFLKVVKRIGDSDYTKNLEKGRLDLDDVIEAANKQFGTTISFVDPMKDLGDEIERIKNELKDIANLNLNNLRNINQSRAKELLNKKDKDELSELKQLSLKKDMLISQDTFNLYKNLWGSGTYSQGEETFKDYENKTNEFFNRLMESGGKYREIEREFKYIGKEYDRKLAEIALDKAKKVYKEIGGDLISQSDEFLKAMDDLNDESSKNMKEYKGHLENLRKRAEDTKGDLTKSISLTQDELNSLVEDAKNIAATITSATAKDGEFWKNKFDELNIINEKEKTEYISAFLKREENAKKVILDSIDMAIKNADAELSSNIDTNFTEEMKRSLEEAKVVLSTAKLNDLDKRIALMGINRGDSNKNPPHPLGDPIRERAEKFNQRYLVQEEAFQNKQQTLKEERARRTGFLSRLSDMGLDTELVSAQYAKQSDLEDKRTARAQLDLLENYKKDYNELSKKVESGQITLKEADHQSADLISKMRDLEIETSEAKARFVDLDEVSLEDLDKQLEKTKKETKDVEEQSKTTRGQFKGGFQKAVKDMKQSYSAASFGKLIAEDLGNGVSDALYSIVDGTKSAKEAFSDMARSILQDISKMLIRMAVMKAMMAAFGGASGGEVTETGGVNSWSNVTLAEANGGFIPKLRAATGSMVRGGVQGKDSVPAMLMPGEYVLKKSAVDALGTNFLNDLNNNAAQTLTSTAANLMQAPTQQENNTEPSVVNVWVVSKEEEAKMGPSDVIATISKDIMTGGQTRRLIQQVVVGRK